MSYPLVLSDLILHQLFYLGYSQQLTECRESLEQLEGYQNQELAKVKHMLLSAETALELEKQERLKLRDQLEELKCERNGIGQSLSEEINRQQQDATTNTLETSENESEQKKVYLMLIYKVFQFLG